jgi:hypothetical protein
MLSEATRRTSVNYALVATEGTTAARVVTYLAPVISVALGGAILGEPLGLAHADPHRCIALIGRPTCAIRSPRAMSRPM